jgi:hypothetical protein
MRRDETMASLEGTISMPDESNLPLRALVLGGTVALPSPFPTVGSLHVLSDREAQRILGEKVPIELVTIDQTIEPSTQIQRIVQREHIRAIYDAKDGKWSFPGEKFGGAVPDQGIVFVPEDAPVMTRVIFSGTASESAEYRPPTHRDGCDDKHRDGCDRALRNGCDIV